MSTGRGIRRAALAALTALCLVLPAGLAAGAEDAPAATTASTEVELAVVSSFELVRVVPEGADTPDFAGTLAGARGFSLEARAPGAAGEVSGTWTRTIDGMPDAAFSAAGLTHALAGDDLEDGHAYRYTLTATDGAGTARTAEFAVDVLYRASDRVVHAPGSDERVDVAGEVYDDGARRASVFVKRLEGASSPGDALSVLSRAAAERGASVEAAWSVGMVVPAGVEAPPFIGTLTVSFPYPVDAAFSTRLSRAALLAQAGPDVLFLAAGDDQPVLLSTALANGRASFETLSLGTFAVLSGGPAITHVITATASEGGSVDPSGAVSVSHGHDAVFTFTPDAGYAVRDVQVDGVSQGPLASYTFREVGAAHTLAVSFSAVVPAPVLWTLSLSAGEGGAIAFGPEVVEGAQSFKVEQGDAVSLAFLPRAGWHVEDVRVNGASIGRPASYLIPAMSGDVVVEAVFARGGDDPAVVHTVTAEAGAGGSVSPASAQVTHGGDVTFSFVPDAGYKVSEVLVDGGTVEADASLTLRNVVTDHRVQVSFERVEGAVAPGLTHVVSATAGPHGMVSPAGEVSVAEGADAAFAFMPEAGYQVARVVVDGRELAFAPRSWKFLDVREPHSLHVEFEPAAGLAPTGDDRGISAGLAALGFALAVLVLVVVRAEGRARRTPAHAHVRSR